MCVNSQNVNVIGVDLGGTNIRVAKIEDMKISRLYAQKISSKAEHEEVVIDEVISSIENIIDSSIAGIGIGVPGVVDFETGIVYDVQNIPSWKKVSLQTILQDKFNVPVLINNDANCFAVGEKYFGKGKDYKSMIGLIMGTGFGAGLIFDNKLYSGKNCGAGEFGMIPYLENNFEYYCCGQFFKNEYQLYGDTLHEMALKGDAKALKIFEEFGYHVGQAIKSMMFAYDPEIFIIGGSVSNAFDFFKTSMYKILYTFPYTPTANNIKVSISETDNVAVLGAAALYYDSITNSKIKMEL